MLTFYLSLIEDHTYDSKFERIYYKYEKKMFGIALKITDDFHGAEEVLNDAFVTVAKNIAEINESNEEMLKSLLCKITKNAAIDYLRRNKKFAEIANIDTLKDIPSTTDYEEIETHAEYSALIDVIRNMPDTYRDVLILNLVYEMSNGEIAKSLNVNINTVSSRIKRGKAILKKCLKEGKKYE